MVYILFLTVSLCFILPVKLNKYDIILVPISNKPVNIKNWRFNIFGEHTHLRSELNSRNNAMRIDIENYEEPTDIPDLDNFDYFKDRSESKWNDNEYDSESNEYKNKNNKGSDMNFKYYPSELKGNRNSRAKDDEYDNSQYFGDDKIVGGKEVDINLYPYHVAYGSNCGGAIIDKKWVITAGHCGKKPYVKVGSKYLNQGEKVSIKRSIIHPNWSAKNKDHPFDYDFQLLELAHPLKYSDNIQPIKIANMEDMVIGKIITVTGWGNTQENGPYSSVLRAVRVPIISKENCQNVPFPYFRGTLTARMFCAGFPEGKKDACQGDSGGPAVAYDRLLGMVSFGYGCATPGSYGVYSKVAKVRSWIEQHTRLILD